YDSVRRCICCLCSIAAQAPVFVVRIAQRRCDLPRDSRSNRIGYSHRLVIAGMGYEYWPPHLLLRHHLPESSIVFSIELRSKGIMRECACKQRHRIGAEIILGRQGVHSCGDHPATEAMPNQVDPDVRTRMADLLNQGLDTFYTDIARARFHHVIRREIEQMQ